MITYALDASAILRYLDNEAGADRVDEIVRGHLAGNNKAAVLALHWGEIAGHVYRNYGTDQLSQALSNLEGFQLEIISVTAERAVRAALIKEDTKVPYIDAFGVEFAATSPDHIFVTADFDLKGAAHKGKIEFLPVK